MKSRMNSSIALTMVSEKCGTISCDYLLDDCYKSEKTSFQMVFLKKVEKGHYIWSLFSSATII